MSFNFCIRNVHIFSKEVIMKGKKGKRIFLLFVLISLPFTLLFSQTEEARKILEENNAGVISLEAYGDDKEVISEGSGFVVEQGTIATSYQLVSQAMSVEGKNFKGKKVKIEGILAVEKNLNIALLKIKGKALPLSLGDSDELEMGKKVFAVGSNRLGEIIVSEGNVSDFLSLTANQRVIETSLSIPQNFSGAPLLDMNGQVLGMIIFFERKLKFTLPSNLLKTLKKQTVKKFKDWQHEDYLSTLEGAFLAGKISSLLDETGKAQKYLEIVAKSSPEETEIHALLASIYNRQRNYERAISAYKKVLELDRNRDDAYYGLGTVYLKMRRFQEAISPLQKAVELNLDHKNAYFHIGNVYEELKEFAKAAEAYENFLNLKPESAWEAYFRLGLCRIEIGELEKSITAFQSALKDKPRDFKINYNLAQTYQKLKQHEKAEEVFKFLAQISPDDASTFYRTILRMYDEVGKSEKAIEAAKYIIEMNPENEIDVYNLGLMYMKLKRHNEAIETFNEVLALNPAYEYAYYYIGYCYSQQKKYRKSIEAFKKFVELDPDNADGWFNIGIGHMLLKDFESALGPLKKTVELRPDYGNALYNLAIVYLNLHDNYSAREIHKKLTPINPALAQKLKKYLR